MGVKDLQARERREREEAEERLEAQRAHWVELAAGRQGVLTPLFPP